MRWLPRWGWAFWLSAMVLGSCTADTGDVPRPSPVLADLPYDTLSEYGFFVGHLGEQEPAPGVVLYEVTSPLWSDFADKGRYVFLPEGTFVTYRGDGEMVFPLGSIVIKSFYLMLNRSLGDESPSRLIETRLLILEDEGWTGHTYVFNDEETEATRRIAGARLTFDVIGTDGAATEQLYQVPNNNECGSCHERSDTMHLLGFVGPQLHREVQRDGEDHDQLSWLHQAGLFADEPSGLDEIDSFHAPFGDSPLELRARDYLHSNCGHCHREGGDGGRSGLSLLRDEMVPARYGVCKGPVAAGRGTGGLSYDINPGDPDSSIIVHRMQSTDPEVKMPELPQRIPHMAGIELIREWIASMDPQMCGE